MFQAGKKIRNIQNAGEIMAFSFFVNANHPQ